MNRLLKAIKAKYIFAIYLVGLVNFVVVKYFGSVHRVMDRIENVKSQKAEGYWHVQLVPFRTIISSWDSYRVLGSTIQRQLL
ncbi:hypothetical protein A8990_12621 [Paenibacillus taihuensis]|uniref:Uncharacterized protein n=1 Tax=Paenibacillus taihuensis TaxID=1156355 RepID=A0A3D9RIC3_9BACL|nr:hypothetical protein A8990_12621 [Paenibacillus taihuensis]